MLRVAWAILKRCAACVSASPWAIRPASVRRSPRRPRPIRAVQAVCEPVVFDARQPRRHPSRRRERRRRPRRLRHAAPRRRGGQARRGRRNRHGAAQQARLRAGRAAVEGPHRSAGAPVRRGSRADAVLRAAQRRRALCVTLATVHVPLADVPRLLTTAELVDAPSRMTVGVAGGSWRGRAARRRWPGSTRTPAKPA